MRLERLELSGFKSFPERAELRFDKGVTAIVGPNGCGKSNLVDAITWVLGEQSARSLRGDRMEDVIFSGSDARKPTAAAEVKVKLIGVASSRPARLVRGRQGGNGDGRGQVEEAGRAGGEPPRAAAEPLDLDLDGGPTIVRDVEVARRLYRSGESEYLIDGEVVRLRDVHDLLMDAGIGVKGYAVIEQGKIEQILAARPTERRQLIEEAAGITKYKSRRRAAELKLEAARQNLARVEDIVFEVERQRNALRRQAAKARRYARLREALRRWEKVVFARRYRVLAEAIETVRARLAAVRAREAAASAQVAESEARAEAARLALAEAETRATEAREAAHAAEVEIGRRQQQLEFDREQLVGLERAAAELDEEIRALERRRTPTRAEAEGRRAALAEVEAERARAAARLADLEAVRHAAEQTLEGLEADVEAARSEVFSALNAATALRHAVEHAAAAREKVDEEIARLEAERRDLEVDAARVAHERAAAREALTVARAALSAAREAAAAREVEQTTLRARRDALAQACRTLEQELAAARARLASLEELDAARAEYGEAARLVLTDPTIDHLGALADYLEVDGPYTRAVEACLGDRLQYVVVRRHEAAAAGLETVRARQAGRCGFVVLEAPLPPPARTTAPDGVVPLASVLRVSGPHATAIAAAIGEGWIAESFAQAARVAASVSAPVATLAGDVFHGAQLVEGGSGGERRGILALKGEIRELGARVAALERDLAAATAELAALDDTLGGIGRSLAACQADIHAHEKAVVGHELRVAATEEAGERLARRLALVEAERARAQEERRVLDARQAEAVASIARLEAEQREADARFLAAQRELLAAREALAAQGAQLSEAKAASAALVERAAGLAVEVRRLDDALRDLDERLAARGAERERTIAQHRSLGEAVRTLERQLDRDVAAFDALRAQVRARDDDCARLRAQLEDADRAVREARHALDGARAEVGQLDVARAKAEADLAHLAEACVEATQAALDTVAAEVADLERAGALEPGRAGGVEPEGEGDEEADAAPAAGARGSPAVEPPATAEDMIARLREKIDRLGPVNMMAVEQFDELESRHAFLTTQRQDLVDAIAATGEAIRRIDKTTRERFQEAFTCIDAHFQETFVTLFGGGRAGLVLLDETDQLESGIDIVAQPPGKRLQNVQLLSGGEKALVAMALMFALFRYRPSPFCLLDEIDAPLDDANIGRFVEMLQRMQDKTQFIVITHNRKTMEIADRLYGVTMEEPGVSKLISVQLN